MRRTRDMRKTDVAAAPVAVGAGAATGILCSVSTGGAWILPYVPPHGTDRRGQESHLRPPVCRTGALLLSYPPMDALSAMAGKT